jgi:uncharacterized Rmd1/YagE family protein
MLSIKRSNPSVVGQLQNLMQMRCSVLSHIVKTTASSVYDRTVEDVEYIYNMTVLLLFDTYTELVIDVS